VKLSAAALVTVLAVSIPATPLAGQATRAVDPDSVVSIEIPTGWTEVDLGNPDASLTFADPAEDAFFMVIVEMRADLFGWNLTKMQYVTLAQSVAAMDFPEVDGPTFLEIDGSDAVRWDLQGATSGANIRFAKVVVDAPSAFIQLIGWTGLSVWEEKGPLVEGVLESALLLP
jgi:hypothetical protein